jgi:hypothetical protein
MAEAVLSAEDMPARIRGAGAIAAADSTKRRPPGSADILVGVTDAIRYLGAADFHEH